jgi:hypothetical protein
MPASAGVRLATSSGSRGGSPGCVGLEPVSGCWRIRFEVIDRAGDVEPVTTGAVASRLRRVRRAVAALDLPW